MKKLIVICVTLFLCSCSVNTSSNVNFKGEDLKYFKDIGLGYVLLLLLLEKLRH